jgi:DNA-directed RNA polymerase specialized sigma subunit, sigma24 homolog
MSIAEKIAPHLPYLRRFGRALTGNQERGDAYVLAVLEALIADPAGFPTHGDARVALYSCFLKIWNSISLNNDPPVPSTSTADRRLEVLTPRPRQAFFARLCRRIHDATGRRDSWLRSG